MEAFFENCQSPLESMGIISVNAMEVELVRYALNVNQNYITNRDENMVHIKSQFGDASKKVPVIPLLNFSVFRNLIRGNYDFIWLAFEIESDRNNQ